MGVTQSLIKDHREKVLLVVYFIIMVIIAGPLFQTLGEAWQRSDLLKPIILAANPVLSVNLQQFTIVCFGLYLGLLVLFTYDPKKRWQGVLLWIGTGSALFGLMTVGLFIPNLNFGDHSTWLIVGAGAGIIAGGGYQVFQIRTVEALEFRRSAVLLYGMITVIVIFGLIEYHVDFPELLVVGSDTVNFAAPETGISVQTGGALYNIVLAGVFLVTLKRFVQYDAEESFFVLGPRGSGKSLFLVGTYLAALDEAEKRKMDAPLKPSGDLMDLVSEVGNVSPDGGGSWGMGATDASEAKQLRFQYLSGKVFPKNMYLTSRDYAGEYLVDLPDGLMAGSSSIDDTTLQVLVDEVKNSDTLILLIDIERYMKNESIKIEPYFDILNAASGKDVILIATKADLLAEEFKDRRAIEAHQYFDEFQEFVHNELVDNSRNVQNLVLDTAGSEIHPVYYQTTVNDEGERVPMRDRAGNVMTIGFDELLEKMG